MIKNGKEHKFFICLSKNSNGQGLKDLVVNEENVAFLNRSECCERFNIQDSDDNIKIIEEIISEVPLNSVVLIDEVPLSSKSEDGRPSYDWSSLKNNRPGEVTAVVCLQPVHLDVTFKTKDHDVVVPKAADTIWLSRQFRNTTNIQNFVNQLRDDYEELPVEYANVQCLPSHDVEGPDILAVSMSDLNQAGDTGAWLCNQLQKELVCKPGQVKMIYQSSTKELAESVTQGTAYKKSLVSVNDFQGCETPVAVIFWGTDSNYSQLLEMCSRAQYKLILVIQDNQPLCDMIGRRSDVQISVQNLRDLNTQPALLTAAETGNLELVRQLLECGASLEVTNVDRLTPLQIATNRGFSDIRQELMDHEQANRRASGMNITITTFLSSLILYQ